MRRRETLRPTWPSIYLGESLYIEIDRVMRTRVKCKEIVRSSQDFIEHEKQLRSIIIILRPQQILQEQHIYNIVLAGFRSHELEI